MSLAVHPVPRLAAVVAWALALTVAAGVSTPRLRAAGRERASRAGIARAGSQRPDDPRAWVAPDTEHNPEYTVADAVIGVGTDVDPAAHSDGLFRLLPSVRWTAAAPSLSLLANPAAPGRRLRGSLLRPASGRAPPHA